MGISTHILDMAAGKPAAEVPVLLAYLQTEDWVLVNATVTDGDGRAKYLLPIEAKLTVGKYRARFDTAAYYEAQGIAGLYPYVDVVFEVRDAEQHHHIPLLLTANGYTTYRGT